MSRLSLLYAMIAICLSTTLCLSTSRALGQENQTEGADDLLPADHRSCVFADEKFWFGYSSQNAVARDIENWHIDWFLIAGARTLARGSSKAKVLSDSDVPLFHAEISTPPLRDAVVLPAQLQMTWTSGEKKYRHNRPLFIFSRNPFAAQRAFLEAAQIKLFDAEGKTAELLDAHEIPHSRLLNLSAIDLVTEGMLIVGEGVSFRKQRKLAETLLRAARRGVPVLCLAPAEGDILLTTQTQVGQLIRPSRLVLERGEVVRHYDKRFDEIPTICPFLLEPRRNEVVLCAAGDQEGWSWLELEFPPVAPEKTPGRLIVCGLGLVTHWDTSPVPRYLLVHLLKLKALTPSTLEEQEHVYPRK